MVAAGVASGLLLLAATLVFAVDPCARFRAPGRFKLQYPTKHALVMIPGLLRNLPRDSVVVGDSTLINTSLADVREILGWEAVKATANGSTPAALSRFMDIAFASGIPRRNILLGLHMPGYAHAADHVAFSLNPSFFEPRPWNLPGYLWNRDILADPLFHTLQTTLGGGKKSRRRRAEPDTMFVFEFPAEEDRYFGEAFIRGHLKSAKPQRPPDAHTAGEMMDGLEANLLRHVRGHRETRFEIVLPPCSALQWHLARQQDNWPVLVEFQRAALAALIAERNVRVHNLQTDRAIVCDFSNYKDHIHYKPSINRWLLERVAAGDRVMSADDIPAFIEDTTRLGDAENLPAWLLDILRGQL